MGGETCASGTESWDAGPQVDTAETRHSVYVSEGARAGRTGGP